MNFVTCMKLSVILGRLGWPIVRVRNLSLSFDQIRLVAKSCDGCAKCKPQCFRTAPINLIKATHSIERLSIDFKGSHTTSNQRKYTITTLTIFDQYYRFPFAFPCKCKCDKCNNASSKTVRCF